ncbi:MAG: selenocysteine-specific translation elongation factor [Candidatus Helarchaeota archaeon]
MVEIIIDNLIPINIGLLGHIDHGKTAIARVLSEIISTAGLDKHKQAQERGISIDIGITSFILDNKYLITLVDAPGHADLIRSVVAASNIIDGAIVVIAADEGPKIQTGEHLLILESFNINNILIALNKIDLVSNEKLNARIQEIKSILKDTKFVNAPIIPVSAKTNEGFDKLKDALLEIIKIPNRNKEGPFKMPIDHAFQIKGAGTVITGTIHRGTVNIGDEIEIMPLKIIRKVKSIQIFRQNRSKAVAGQRVGISLIKLPPDQIYRGYYACKPGSLTIADKIIIKGKINKLFTKGIKPKHQVHLTIGMPTVSGTIFPFLKQEELKVIREFVPSGSEFYAYVQLNEKISIEENMPVLISRLDIDPTKLRIVANGIVKEILTAPPEIYKYKIKEGIVKNIDRKEGVVVEGFSNNIIGAKTYIGYNVVTENGITGKVIDTFGSKGSLLVKFDEKINIGSKVYMRKLRRYVI